MNGENYSLPCPLGRYLCETSMMAAMQPNGRLTFSISRGCAENPSDHCTSQIEKFAQHKNCSVTCDPSIAGSGCNTGLEEISDKFEHESGVDNCFQCTCARGSCPAKREGG